MATFWLKALGLSGHPVQDDWANKLHYGHQKAQLDKRVMFPRKPRIKPGDRLVYYAVGNGVIFAEGEALSIPYEEESFIGPDKRPYPWWVNMRIDHRREFIHDGIPLNDISVGERELSRLMRRRSHIRLTRAEYNAAVRALKA